MNHTHYQPLPKPHADELIGAWRLIEYSLVSVSSPLIHSPLGVSPQGLIIYTPGFMSVQIEGNPLTATAIAKENMAYSGRYTYDEQSAVITHHIQFSTHGAWAHSDQHRHLSITENRLTLRSVDPIIQDGQAFHATLVWEKQCAPSAAS